MSPAAKKRLERLIKTLERAMDQMEGNAEVTELVDRWRGSLKIKENIAEFVDWHRRQLGA